MPTVKLERSKFVPSPEPSLGRREVLTRAAEKLNYKPTVLVEELSRRAKRDEEQVVAKALDELGIEPLDPRAVEAYKAAEKRKIERKSSNRFVQFMHSANRSSWDGSDTVGALVVGFILSFLIGLMVIFIPQDHPPYKYPRLDIGICIWVLSLAGAWVICMVARHKRCTTFTGRWMAQQLNEYRSPVPEFVLERALQVKAALPAAAFAVQWLEESSQNVPTAYNPPAPDPFLVMGYGNVVLYLDVWDEPKFEGRRTV